jgi:hypothetical protein
MECSFLKLTKFPQRALKLLTNYKTPSLIISIDLYDMMVSKINQNQNIIMIPKKKVDFIESRLQDFAKQISKS